MISPRPIALVTGVGRRAGIGAAIVTTLAARGWDVATTYWSDHDRILYGEAVAGDPETIGQEVRALGASYLAIEVDLADEGAPRSVFDRVEATLGTVAALVLNHTYCEGTALLATTAEALDRHYAVNVRAVLLLIQEFARRHQPDAGFGRIVALTSDHTAGNVAYGVTKGAADRLVDAAAYELGHLGITANAINPGPTDTGWMTEEHRGDARRRTPLPRLGTASDAAELVAFLCSPAGGWITGQLLHSNGGFRGTLG